MNPPPDYHDRSDAPRRELIIYSLGGVIDDISGAAFRNLTTLLTIGFGFSPLIAGAFSAIRTLAAGLLDPVVAHLSDNTRSRWGRRRPYILAGCFLMALFGLITWAALPETSRIQPNQPATQSAPSVPKPPRDPAAPQSNMWDNLSRGVDSVLASSPEDQRLLTFLFTMFLGVSVAGTLHSAAYYALGVEIAPSYEGRTRAMAWRSFASGLINILAAGFLPFCFLPFFTDFRQGSLALSILAAALGIPLSLWCFFGTRERTVVIRPPGNRPSFWKSVREIGAMTEFWRVFGLFFVLGKAIGIFQVFGIFLVVYYVFGGDLLQGTSWSAAMGITGTVTGLLAIPFIVWLCNRFQKHNAFRISLAILLAGSVLKYFCYDPGRPWLLLAVPFFYVLGNASVYNILATMMADVTDLDELRHGERREAMFGAVVSVLNKSASAAADIISGGLVIAVGFEISRGADQAPGVFHQMLVFFSIVPALAGLAGFALLYRYPLTRARVAEIKEQLAHQRALRAAQA